MQNTRNDLNASLRSNVCEKLQPHLTLLLDLKLQAKQAHWNVKGPNFASLHELFDKLASEADEYADEVAERIVQLGGTANGLSKTIASGSSLPAFPVSGEWTALVSALANSVAAAGKSARGAIDEMDELGDKDAADMFTAISRGLDKTLWMLEAHLGK